MNKRIDDICNGRKIIAKHVKPESLLNPYSHKALKAAGQIPHDTNEIPTSQSGFFLVCFLLR